MTKGCPMRHGRLLAQIPLGRLGTADEVAQAVAFLASQGPATSPAPNCTSTGGMHMC